MQLLVVHLKSKPFRIPLRIQRLAYYFRLLSLNPKTNDGEEQICKIIDAFIKNLSHYLPLSPNAVDVVGTIYCTDGAAIEDEEGLKSVAQFV